jgi:hypothetical protein
MVARLCEIFLKEPQRMAMFLYLRSCGIDNPKGNSAVNEDVITVRVASRLHTRPLPGLYVFLVFIYFP